MMSLPRLLRIIVVALRYRLDELVLSGIEHPVAYRLLWLVRLGSRPTMPRGLRLRLALEALGPIFVKFGQVLSTRRDLIPMDIADELALLQDRVAPFASDKAAAMIEAALGAPTSTLFAQFETDPVASASIAQVHFAVLHDGRHVAVKVLRPGMLEVIDKDLSLMRVLASLIQRLVPDGRRLKPREVVAEFDKHLHDELDLLREAANCSQLRRNFGPESKRGELLWVPEVMWDYCASTVFTMERMYGIPVSQIERLKQAALIFLRWRVLASKYFLHKSSMMVFFTPTCTQAIFMSQISPRRLVGISRSILALWGRSLSSIKTTWHKIFWHFFSAITAA